jgi:23S rRNA (guanosine2251-2'-O)-methyltransferase
MQQESPKDRFLTVYGRNPVLSALDDPELEIDKIIIADNARGPAIEEIVWLARDRGVQVQRASAQRVKVLAGNGKQDQGVMADIVVPKMQSLATALASDNPPNSLLLLDSITTPGNVGMILRTATAANVDGIIVPRRGVATIDPMVIKASAGVAFHAPILRVGTAADAAQQLREAGYTLFGLAADAKETIFTAYYPPRSAFVLGGESEGLSADVREQLTTTLSIPMASTVESLNVASAAAVLCFELLRRDISE